MTDCNESYSDEEIYGHDSGIYGTEIPGLNVDLDEVNDLLTALNVITDIKYLDKLLWNEEDSLIPNIQVNGPFRFIRRIYNMQNRKDMIERLQKIIYKSISAFKFSSAKVRIKTNLISCVTGLHNLKLTYNDDTMVKSQLNVMIQNIQKVISE
ncbi:MAG: hypothetical protein CMF80_08265 [Candidatus Marinimicrobia bacterium]|nr:hypothetical protein [Candidatus Neomarinimicrobiota bacterium]|tara:strand:- start:61 stop:519 length:459 start_codon:yes stop_codon:yes gene_type:complete